MAVTYISCKATVVVVMCCFQDVVNCRWSRQTVVWCGTMKCGSVVGQVVSPLPVFTAGNVRAIPGDRDLTYHASWACLA